jgi:hypothetical protein
MSSALKAFQVMLRFHCSSLLNSINSSLKPTPSNSLFVHLLFSRPRAFPIPPADWLSLKDLVWGKAFAGEPNHPYGYNFKICKCCSFSSSLFLFESFLLIVNFNSING